MLFSVYLRERVIYIFTTNFSVFNKELMYGNVQDETQMRVTQTFAWRLNYRRSLKDFI
jgi:hypothetical protein